MKPRYIVLVLAVLTAGVIGFIFDNVFSIWEQASYTRFRPVTTGLPAGQINRDVSVGGVTADIFTAPKNTTSAKRPLLVVVHGGFLQGGNKKNYAYLGGLGVRHGYTVAIVQLPHFPGMFTRPFYSSAALAARALPGQAKQFAEFIAGIKALAGQYGFDGERIHILAHGSGALLLGEADVTLFKSTILVSPIYSLTQNVSQIAPMQLRAIDGFIKDADALKLSPAEWLKKTSNPVLILCTERDLPNIKDACKNAALNRNTAVPVERVIVKKPSHFELMFHLGSKVEDATEPLKKFLLANAK